MFQYFNTVYNFSYAFPALPRFLTALCEWAGCLLCVSLLPHRFGRLVTNVFLFLALPVQFLLRCGISGEVSDGLFYVLMAANVAFMLFVIGVLTDLPFRGIMFWWTVAFLWAEFTASLVWHIVSVLLIDPSLTEIRALLFCLLGICLCGAAFLLFLRGKTMELQYEYSMMIAALGVTFLVFMGSNYSLVQSQAWVDDIAVRHPVGWVRTLSDFCGLAVVLLLLNNAKAKKQEQEMLTLKNMVSLQYQQYLDYKNNSEYISRQCHDLKHQVQALRQHMNAEEQNKFLEEIEQAIENYGASCNTGNPVLDTLLTQRQQFCGQHEIGFSYHVDATRLDFLAVKDICIIFGNLLDNAVEHVLQIEDAERRQILVNVEIFHQFLKIEVENCCLDSPKFIDGLPVTTKKEKQLHGIGLKSVRLCVEKYDGTCKCSAEDGWFSTDILIPLR